MRKLLASLFIASSILFAGNFAYADQACGLGKNECEIPLGKYNIELPERNDANQKIPAMIYFHGAGGSGQRSLRNRDMVETFKSRGYAVIAPSGLKRPNSRFGPGWSFHPDFPERRDELAFAKAILDDAAQKFNLDRDNMLMTGFSIGGSLAWYLACKDPGITKAYAPIAGAFWRPHPVATECNGPFNMLHTHGWRDGTVPLEGRVIGGGRIEQGDVFHSLRVLREINGCDNYKADEFAKLDIYWSRWWKRCTSRNTLQFNLHYGGHIVPVGWATQAINWFEGLEKTN